MTTEALLNEVVMVAGPNGSGKPTAVDEYVRRRFAHLPYLNADNIVRRWREEGAVESAEDIGLRAARAVDAEAMALASRGTPFVIESVLSSGKYRPLVELVRKAGVVCRLVYVTTVDPEINVGRVRERVVRGGHDVPEDKIRARWERSMAELPWFAARADRVVVADNSGEEPVAIALRHLGRELELTGAMPGHPAIALLRPLVGASPLPPHSP